MLCVCVLLKLQHFEFLCNRKQLLRLYIGKFDNVEFTRYLLQTYLKKYQYTALNICGMNVESVENIEEHIEKKRRHIEENIEENFVAN